ncbi:MAG: N-acetyltransferase family protein [Gaiellaceae bacterium]
MSVRRAEERDAGAVLTLLAGLGRPAVTADPEPQEQVFRAHLADDACTIFVADDGAAIAGVASLWTRPRLNWPTPEAWLPDLYVDRAFRRRGHGRALIDACAEEARRRGCHRLVLESGHGRAEAHHLYESAGFDHYARSYELRLS